MSESASKDPALKDDGVNIEVNGVALKAKKGAMIMQVTDAAGVYIPRFCYHEKLSIAANCRMCLVEVEKAPKPLPACATPVTEGMKVFTKSPRAIAAQKATMEFLLINHPLDCPICDQGGECELQDLALGFGRDISRFNERKRVVKDKNLGPLVSTDMTRCIHCTRCIRFGQEIAGIQELGTTNRSEFMEVGTYVEHSVDHELSGNIIDVCPVGALNSKPFRYRARAWEMTQHPLVSPHDGVGSNIYGHVLRGRLMRVVPRPNEAINETWIADRDRFSYEGIYAEDRLLTPMIRQGDSSQNSGSSGNSGEWRSVGWEQALEVACVSLKQVIERHGAGACGVLAAPNSTLEELYLTARLARGLGIANIDHRLRQQDFRDQESDPLFPSLGMTIAAIEQLDALLIVGSNLRHEAPMLAHRVRKAALGNAARIAFLNPARYEYLFPVAAYLTAGGATDKSDQKNGVNKSDAIVVALAAVVAATAQKAARPVPAQVQALVGSVKVTAEERALADALLHGERRAILLGALAMRHPAYADLRQLALALAELTGARLAYVPEGGNAAGAYLAGVLPHRDVGGQALQSMGLHARAMFEAPLKAYVLLGGIEPDRDLSSEQANAALSAADCVIALTPFVNSALLESAQVLLPMGTFAETSGTFVNIEGRWQGFTGAAKPVGESRPGWKVLRVLGNLLALAGFEYESSEAVRDELQGKLGPGKLGDAAPDNRIAPRRVLDAERPQGPWVDIPIYQVDALVRRAPALQNTRDGQEPPMDYS
jgi:NADH-quinone oxidoreductase subunit G